MDMDFGIENMIAWIVVCVMYILFLYVLIFLTFNDNGDIEK